MAQYRTESQGTTGGLDVPRALVLVVALLFVGPALLAGALWLLVWRRLGRRRGRPLSRWWIVALFALSLVPALLAGRAWDDFPPAVAARTQYAALEAGLFRLRGREDLIAGDFTTRRYLGGVLPTWLPGSVLAACAVGWWTRPKKSPLQVREATGVGVSERVERRLAQGVAHPPDGWALGFTAEGRQIAIGDAEGRHHVAVCGATGAGKTTVIRHLLDGVAHRCPLVIVDCKASRSLRGAVAALPGGVVWEIGGPVRWDALRGDRTAFASKLLAAEPYGAAAGVYRAAAQRYLQWVGVVLDLAGAPRDPLLIAELLSPKALLRLIRRVAEAAEAQGRAAPAELEHVTRLIGDMEKTQHEGVAGFASRYGVTVEGAVGTGLGTGAGALVLEEALAGGRTVLFSLDAAAYPLEARKVGAWALLDLVRVAGALQAEGWGDHQQAYFVVDEFSALEEEGRHVVPVLARAREAGIACVVATQGLADLARVDRALPQQVVQNTAVRVLLRQGSAEDALAWARHGGEYEREELSRHLDSTLFGGFGDTGRAATRWRRDFYVSPDELRVLGTGEAVVWAAPLGRQPRRIERVRVAPPRAEVTAQEARGRRRAA